MKKIVLLFFAFILVSLNVMAQSKQDQAVILKKCLDLPEIQKYFPVDGSNNPLRVVMIERHPSLLRFDLSVKKFNMDLKYVYESEIENVNPEMYLIFNEFNVSDVAGNIAFDICFSPDSGKKNIHVSLAISKEGADWTVLDRIIK